MCITCVLNHMSKSLSIICSRLYEKSNRFCDIFSMNFLMKLKKEQDVFYTQLRNTNSIMGKQIQTLIKFEFCRDKDTFIKTVWQKLGQTDQDVDL